MSKTDRSRREFLRNTAAAAAFAAMPGAAATAAGADAGAKESVVDTGEAGGFPISKSSEFGNVERGDPLPYKQSIEKLREIGMVRETWKLEVIADPKSNAKIKRQMLIADGTALTFDGLMKIAAAKAVSYFKVMTCNNGGSPLGQGLWEGVPLREVLWEAGPVENLRHVYYYGHHNENEKQIFKCYLPMNRVFEEPPGEMPVMLCYKLNGEFLTGQRGGPVRMIVPEAYGFKNVKWLHGIVFTNAHQSDDTYAGGNNDVNDSWLKTMARFRGLPAKHKTADPLTLHGIAQVGVSGLAKVQYWIRKGYEVLPPDDDPYYAKAPWEDARIVGFDPAVLKDYAGAPLHPAQIDPATHQPRQWPLRYTECRWTTEARKLEPGKYGISCRTIDLAGNAQPMPRPFPKSGKNGIETVPLEVT